MKFSIEKLGTLLGIATALSASVGGYFVIEDRQNTLINSVETLSQEMKEVRESSDLLLRVGVLETKSELAEPYDDRWIKKLSDDNMNKIIVINERMRKIKDMEKIIEEEILPSIDDIFDDIDKFTGR
jgi:hypothetical protein